MTRNIWHSCGKFSLKALFAGSEQHVFRLFRKFEKMVRTCGPVTMIPQKTRVVFMVRVRYAGAYPRKSYLLCGIALPRRHKDARIIRTEEYAPHFIGHIIRIDSEDQLDERVQQWLREAYDVGSQEVLHMKSRKRIGERRKIA